MEPDTQTETSDLPVITSKVHKPVQEDGYYGSIDNFDGKGVGGWVFPSAQREEPITLQVFILGENVGTCVTRYPRADISDAIGVSIFPGFRFNFSDIDEKTVQKLVDKIPSVNARTKFADVVEVRINAAGPNLPYYSVLKKENTALAAISETLNGIQSETNVAHESLVKANFDEEYYRSLFSSQSTIDDPLQHFLSVGMRLSISPTPEFDYAYYLENNPDARTSDDNPFVHWLLHKKNGASPASGGIVPRPREQGSATSLDEAFDPNFYKSRYLKGKDEQVDPLQHYKEFGWRNGHDPAPWFSVRYYLETYPDIAAAEIDPFEHYMQAGRLERRLPRHPGGHKSEALQGMSSLEDDVAHTIKYAPYGQFLNEMIGEQDLIDLLAKRSPKQRDAKSVLYLSFTHDAYVRSLGGIQLCVDLEQRLAAEDGARYLALFPIHPIPRLVHDDEMSEFAGWGLILDGEIIGAIKSGAFQRVVSALHDKGVDQRVVIHQPMGHSISEIVKAVKNAGRNDCVLWLHDYISLCPSYALQRNKISYCGAPAIDSNACAVCVFGEERRRHVDNINLLFESLNVHVFSPSDAALQVWRDGNSVLSDAASERVIPHISLVETDIEPKLQEPADEGPIKIAFVGTIAPHKGWPIFERLMYRFGADSRFHFVYLGKGQPNLGGIEHVSVGVSGDDPNEMTNAIARENIDAVLHWASWPETFSLSTFEAMAGGAVVLTNRLSGNVAAAVETLRLGYVVEEETTLSDLISSAAFAEAVWTHRKDRARKKRVPHYSRLVHDGGDVWTETLSEDQGGK